MCSYATSATSSSRKGSHDRSLPWLQQLCPPGIRWEFLPANRSSSTVPFHGWHERDCDCVVAGFRWYRKGDRPAIGSLLLGLYDDYGVLQHVRVCGSFTLKKRDLSHRERLARETHPTSVHKSIVHLWAILKLAWPAWVRSADLWEGPLPL
jgi:hypothetical protein